MSRILITSGPTRQYLDPVRYLTNASSGRMGHALAQAALDLQHEVLVVSGPVALQYPQGCRVLSVVTTPELLQACSEAFPNCDGLISAAAPCDYQPIRVETHKIAKTGQPLMLELVETPDVVASLGSSKRLNQWVVGFALETDDQRFRAVAKMLKKSCDLMVVNGPSAIDSARNRIEILDRCGQVLAAVEGTKDHVAKVILEQVQLRLISARGLPASQERSPASGS